VIVREAIIQNDAIANADSQRKAIYNSAIYFFVTICELFLVIINVKRTGIVTCKQAKYIEDAT